MNSEGVSKEPFPEDLPEQMQYVDGVMTDLSNLTEDDCERELPGEMLEMLRSMLSIHVVAHEHREDKLFHRIRWYACPPEEDTWKP